jgi:two-component system OmpR family response regulator
MHALVVDDDLEIATLVQKILQSRGFKVTLAPNGKEALRLVRRSAPDLIVLDVMMPGIDGTTVLAELRRLPALDATRVVMLTAKGAPRDAQESHRIGADAYVTKPFAMHELLRAALA